MRKVASNRVYYGNGLMNHQTNCYIEIIGKNAGKVYTITEETPMTEWLPGIIVITADEALLMEIIRTKDLSLLHSLSHNQPSFAYHISEVDFEHNKLTDYSTITLLTE